MWVTAPISEKEEYKFEPHSFKLRILNFEYCQYCGLVALRNPLSAWSIKMGCKFDAHPGFRKAVKQLT